MAVGLAVSGGASAGDKPSNYELLTEGYILMKSALSHAHLFTVIYDKAIFSCAVAEGEVGCIRVSDKKF